jgi:hypothetical protein
MAQGNKKQNPINQFAAIWLTTIAALIGCTPQKSSEQSTLTSDQFGGLALEEMTRRADGMYDIKCLAQEKRQTVTEREIINNIICVPDSQASDVLLNNELEDIKKLKIQPAFTNEWNPNWSVILAESIITDAPQLLHHPNLGRSEVRNYCPNFSNLKRADKVKFWIIVFSSIARFESAFNPKMRYEERKNFWSEGLLQLSYGDEKQHRDCKISLARQNIFDPQINLHCGVVIMRSQILQSNYGKIFTHGYFYYWSVLRNKIGAIDGEIKKHMNQIIGCK